MQPNPARTLTWTLTHPGATTPPCDQDAQVHEYLQLLFNCAQRIRATLFSAKIAIRSMRMPSIFSRLMRTTGWHYLVDTKHTAGEQLVEAAAGAGGG